MYDPVADLRLAASFLASIETGRPVVDARITALAAAVRAVADGLNAGPVDRALFDPDPRDDP